MKTIRIIIQEPHWKLFNALYTLGQTILWEPHAIITDDYLTIIGVWGLGDFCAESD